MSACRLGFRIVEEQPDIGMKSPLVTLEGQDVVAVLIDDPPGDVTLAIEGGHDRSLERQHLQQLGHGGDFIGFRSGGDLRQDEALPQAVTSADLPLAVSNERRRTLPSIATTPWAVSAKRAMKR